MVGYRIGTGWRNPHQSGVCFQPPRNPHQGGEVFARKPFDGSTLDAPGRNPHRSGVCFATQPRMGHRPWLFGETPTEAGRCLRAISARLISVASTEKPPPKWGGTCEHSSKTCKHCWRNPHRSGEVFARAPSPTSPTTCQRNPHRSGCALRDFGQHCVNVNRKTPTEVGPPSPTTKFSRFLPPL
jgi:hypothetical protein